MVHGSYRDQKIEVYSSGTLAMLSYNVCFKDTKILVSMVSKIVILLNAAFSSSHLNRS